MDLVGFFLSQHAAVHAIDVLPALTKAVTKAPDVPLYSSTSEVSRLLTKRLAQAGVMAKLSHRARVASADMGTPGRFMRSLLLGPVELRAKTLVPATPGGQSLAALTPGRGSAASGCRKVPSSQARMPRVPESISF